MDQITPKAQFLIQSGNLPREQFLTANRRHRAGEVGPLLGVVAHHHDFIEVVGSGFQPDVDGAAVADSLLNGRIPNKAEDQRLIVLSRDGIGTGSVGNGAVRGAFDGY